MSEGIVCSEKIQKYFNELEKKTKKAYDIANKARKKGFDPEKKVDILLAESVGKRVEGLIGSIEPKIINSGVSERIKKLEKKYGSGDSRVGMVIAHEISNQKFFKIKKEEHAVSIGIRTGLAYTTNGVVSAPLEGISDVKLKPTQDNKSKYISVYFAGPIRGAGSTQQVITLIIADYVRVKKGLKKYKATKEEIKRYYTEVTDYYERVERKQYKPTQEEMDFIIPNMPIEINGDPTSRLEVSNYKNLPRVETNRIRGGMALVLTDGVVKFPKVWKRVSKWGKSFGLDWTWLKNYLKLKKKIRSKSKPNSKKENKNEQKLTPNFYYVSEIVAGRPVFGYPLKKGGFRIRYGRSRLTGDGSWAVSPTTAAIAADFLATGTQLRVERVGKSTALTMCDSIENPIVKLNDDSIIYVKNVSQAKKIRNKIKEILFLGDILISHGEFVENSTKLVPPGYCEEWWVLELKNAEKETNSKLEQIIDPKTALEIKKNPFDATPTFKQALKISLKLKVPLHPHWTLHWKDISEQQFNNLVDWYLGEELNLKIETDRKAKRTLELIGCPHELNNKKVVLTEFKPILDFFLKEKSKGEDGLSCINKISPVKQRDKSGTYMGARMGRPEKAKARELKGKPNVLFPVGEEGGRLRSFNAATKKGKISAQFPIFVCPKCNEQTLYLKCEKCGSKTEKHRTCPICKKITKAKKCHRKTETYQRTEIDINKYLLNARKQINMSQPPRLIKGVRGTSNKNKVVEYLGKGLLRAKHKIAVNKDGTIRYDMTELGITHFKPKEIGISVERAKQLGYEKDIYGKEINSDEQIIEIFPQDIVLPDNAIKKLISVTKFVDEELEKIYKQKKYYRVKSKKGLIGQIIVGLSPHTSAGIVGRILGFSKTRACFAHPYWHDAQRRDLDGEETSIFLLTDALLNFSTQYLPNSRGGNMDAPLVLSTKLNVEEIDDEVFDVDTVWEYPIEFYEAANRFEKPTSVKIEQIKDRVGKKEQYEGIGYTHPVSNMNKGNCFSAYKTIETLVEKMEGQLYLASKIRASNLSKVAQLIIEKHFIRDIKGNLRKFTKQKFRCTNCNSIYRRVPLSGKCSKCKRGNLVFTIAEGTIKKYLESTIKLAEKEGISPYIKQSIDILNQRIESIFGREKTKQIKLGGFYE